MAKDDLEELIKKAAEIAKHVPESMQEAAFNRALDVLLEEDGSVARKKTTRKRSKIGSHRSSAATESAPDDEDSAFDTLLEGIDRTKHPDVGEGRVVDQALKVLELARDEYEFDGLTVAQVHRILSERFRLPATAAAVRMGLGRARKLVNEKRTGSVPTYFLTAPGEAHLRKLRSGKSKDDDEK